ncbi:hypothetical protein A2819_01350 [Candidatus Azambacteria bacterium RIFCSPHIGHO2_01_FULL_40_24]|uniref:DUF192 domain-containing protein n=1 Tax=Candidatus Azambacteria bacterium RIFCSPHIGHO2_01_FULL_40_24 TaxID=1797301 RepID=A0A1F5B4Q6_9BACT|nr:MAG: hypothetical protein A2819_01350 [Candidatus Azambacteria bacterium RIFCSPHIGHO2_01_FULL_40_24]
MLIDSKRPFFLTLTFLIVCLVGIVVYQQYKKIAEKNQVVIYTGAGPVKINVEYAETPEKRISGLMNRSALSKFSGMLFIFPDEKMREFWMKDTLIPLEIIFIGTKGNINEITSVKPCTPDVLNCPIYTSKELARFAIEVNVGFSEQNRIVEGDILEISGF